MLSTIGMKHKLCYSYIEGFEKSGIVRVGRGYQISTIVLIVCNFTKKLLMKVDVVDIVQNIDLKVAHMLNQTKIKPTATHQYNLDQVLAIEKKSALQFYPKTVLCVVPSRRA